MPQQMQLPFEPQALQAAIAGGEGPEMESEVEAPTGALDPKMLVQMLLQMGVGPDKIKAIMDIITGGGGPQVG